MIANLAYRTELDPRGSTVDSVISDEKIHTYYIRLGPSRTTIKPSPPSIPPPWRLFRCPLASQFPRHGDMIHLQRPGSKQIGRNIFKKDSNYERSNECAWAKKGVYIRQSRSIMETKHSTQIHFPKHLQAVNKSIISNINP